MKVIVKTLLLALLFFLVTTAQLADSTARALPIVFAQDPPPVLAFYYAWFDQNTWASGQSADLPAQGYNSADQATIERHIAQAQSAGIDALVQSWLGPQVENNQTETNFRLLLDVAQAKGFKAVVDFETTSPFLGDTGAVTGALTTLLATHVQHPAYLRYQGKPVIFFWRQQVFSVEAWAAIRNQVDPNHNSYWIAEGVDIAYQAVFDGHHLYSIAWADSPAAQLAKWAGFVRDYEAENQVDRLWVATTMPGYDDTRLPRDDVFAVPRRNGDYYRETWQGALASRPDMVIITSFNEWPEGTHIEPSIAYGNFYLDLTRELVTDLRGVPPAAPPPAEVGQAGQETPAEKPRAQDPPDVPYIRTTDLTNVRSGPSTEFEIVGRLGANSAVSVVGRLETGEWWQIEFEPGPTSNGWVFSEVVEFVGDETTVPIAKVPEPPPVATATPGAIDASTVSEPADQVVNETPSVRVPAGGVNVRIGPGLDFELLGRLDEGTAVPVVAKNDTGEWWQIEYTASENGLAWVADVVVDFRGDRNSVPPAANPEANPIFPQASPLAEPAEPVIAGSIEAIDPVNVRSEPSLEGLILGGLFPGETADVLAINQEGNWWQIDFTDAPGQPAWIAGEFVRFTGEKGSVPIFGIGTVTPTPGPTNTPTSTPSPTPTATISIKQPTIFAPTATSVYEATSVALLAGRSTPEPIPTEPDIKRPGPLSIWSNIPWGILSLLVIIGFSWYQFARRGRR
jgi:uncharacterized protein YgiM (DUF1202 family)